MSRISLLALAACTPSETTSSALPPSVTLNCAPNEDNVLRVDCDVTSTAGQDVTLTWGATGAPAEETKVLRAVTSTRTTLLWFEPRTEHTITATGATSGSASTTVDIGELDVAIATDYTVNGKSTVRRFLHESPCTNTGTALISATDGRPLWYQRMAPEDEPTSLISTTMTEDGTVLALAEGIDEYRGVEERDLYGNLVWSVVRTIHFYEGIHHEVVKKNGLYYALLHQNIEIDGQHILTDGFYIFDGSGNILETWYLSEQISIGKNPNLREGELYDATHANSIFVDDTEHMLISFRNMSAVAYVNVDIESADFGNIEWWFGGDPGDPAPHTTFEYVSSAGSPDGFFQQHHASFFEPDRLTIFDNQLLAADSRLLSFHFDFGNEIVDLDEVYTLDRHCDIQGAMYRGPTGNPIGTCPISRTAYEFPRYEAKAFFTFTSRCMFGNEDGVYRYVPIDDRLPAEAR